MPFWTLLSINTETPKLLLLQALTAFLKSLDPSADPGLLAEALEKFNKLLGAIDFGLQVMDTVFQAADLARSQNATLWKVVVTPAELSLSPAKTTVSSGQGVKLTVSVVGVEEGTLLTYHWTTTKGTLINTTNSTSGTSLDTSASNINYQAPSSVTTGEKVTVTVEAFAGGINDPNRRRLGTAQAEITHSAVTLYGAADVAFSDITIPSDPKNRVPIEFVGGTWTRTSPVRLTSWFNKTLCPPSFDGPGSVGLFGLRTGVAFDFDTPLVLGKEYPLELGTGHNWLALKWTTGSGNVESFSFYEGSVTLVELVGKQVSFQMTARCRNSGTPETNPSYYGATVTVSGWFLLQ